jgi:hypothetical protein
VEIGATEYRLAAEEHLSAAAQCHLSGDYLTCHYLSGLAVECMLRAYRWRIDGSWDGRHVLPKLYRESRFDALVSKTEYSRMADSFSLITSRWSNGHRFTSPAKLARYLNEIGATHNIKGDKLKRHSSEIFEAAEYIVGLGVNKWKN